MGGGVQRSSRIDLGLRLSNVLLCFITNETSEDQTCLNQISLAVQLNKPIIPLLLDANLKWPPRGALGPILSEYLFIRFFQRGPIKEEAKNIYWPAEKFEELVMQLKQLIPFTLNKTNIITTSGQKTSRTIHPEVFISYQWDKQKQIIKLYEKLTSLGLTCWLDIREMGGGDSLYDKIDEGLRNCVVVISCVTTKYGLSVNCRKEIALADSLGKPIIPILMDRGLRYPPPGPMAPTLSVLKYLDFSHKEDNEIWEGDGLKFLLENLKSHLPKSTVDTVTSRACVIS